MDVAARVSKYRCLARISRAKGLAGEVVADAVDNLPFSMQPGLPLWVVPPDHGLVRETRVQKVQQDGDAVILSLKGCDDRTCAQRLVGRFLLALDEACEGDVGETEASFMGFEVQDKSYGSLGSIVDIQENTAQTLWTVEGPFGRILIPAVDEFIEYYDKENVYVDLPKGLVELNR